MKHLIFIILTGLLLTGFIATQATAQECVYEWCDAPLPTKVDEKVGGVTNCGNKCWKIGAAVVQECPNPIMTYRVNYTTGERSYHFDVQANRVSGDKSYWYFWIDDTKTGKIKKTKFLAWNILR